MQAVFAGVRHGERPFEKKLPEDTQKSIVHIESRLTSIEMELGKLKKAAELKPDKTQQTKRPQVSSRLNEELFDSVKAKTIRFTVLASSSGQPCLDELEVFDDGGNNVALASSGAVASASGTLPGYAIHQLKHINDGRTGNANSWISNSSGSSCYSSVGT